MNGNAGALCCCEDINRSEEMNFDILLRLARSIINLSFSDDTESENKSELNVPFEKKLL